MGYTDYRELRPGATGEPALVRFPERCLVEFVEVLSDGGRPFTIHTPGDQEIIVHAGDLVPLPEGRSQIGIAEVTTAQGIRLDAALTGPPPVKLLLMDAATAAIRASTTRARSFQYTRSERFTVSSGTERDIPRHTGAVRMTVKSPTGNGANLLLSHEDAAKSGTSMFLEPGASVAWYGPLKAFVDGADPDQDLVVISEVIE